MSAEDELPRGLSLSNSQNQTGVAASVVFPATSGVSWVLSAATAIVTSQGSSVATFPTIEVLDGATVIWSNFMAAEGGAGTVSAQDERDIPAGLESAAGNALTVQFSIVAPASISQNISATAYPI